MAKIDALTTKSKKMGDNARELMQKGNTNAGRKLAQEAWDYYKKPKAKKAIAGLDKCAASKCRNELRVEKEEKLKLYEKKCKEKPGGMFCGFAEDLKKELASLSGRKKTKS